MRFTLRARVHQVPPWPAPALWWVGARHRVKNTWLQRRHTISDHGQWADRRGRTRALVSAEQASDDTIADVLRRLCCAATKDLKLSGAVVNMLVDAAASVVVAATDETSRRLGELHFDFGEGPAQESFATGRSMLLGNLEAVAGRWPGYGQAALSLDARAIFVFPLRVGAARFGLLTLVDDRPHALTQEELERCLSFAALAAELLIDGPGARPKGQLDSELMDALDFRSEVYQAQGMVMVDLGINLGAALARMRAHAFAAGLELGQLSADIVGGRTRLARDVGETP